MNESNCHRIVFLGNSAVGKTSIISQYVFNSCSSDHQSTIGIDYFTKTIEHEGKSIRLIIWDTAGQEKFNAQITSYLHYSTISVLVYDITHRVSFENMQKWHNTVTNSGSPSIIVVGNKVDLESQRQVSYEEGKKYADLIGSQFIETSARTPININELFEIIASIPFSQDAASEVTAKPIPVKVDIQISQKEDTTSKCGC